ncbi:MAG: hypothetical protein H6726_19325 [Sandaracinaceae bacterium]|nr:hypothetical protein [Myxococcales bacterium]MCB9659809.1 hypothetical protein [Sandaracinaceae bacterium]
MMHSNGGTRRDLRRWGFGLALGGVLTALGGWGQAQPGVDPPTHDGASGEVTTSALVARRAAPRVLPVTPDRTEVPPLAALESALATMRREPIEAGRPALEHAALSLAAARTAETNVERSDVRGEAAQAASLQARRIAYAALRLAEAQRGRERARLARNEAARVRASAEAGRRLAAEALTRARENADSRLGAATHAPAAGSAIEGADDRPAEDAGEGDDASAIHGAGASNGAPRDPRAETPSP